MSAATMTDARKRAIRWLQERGGDAAVIRHKDGGRSILAQGEYGPFMPSTCRALIDAGLAEYVDINGRKSVRFRLTEEGRAWK